MRVWLILLTLLLAGCLDSEPEPERPLDAEGEPGVGAGEAEAGAGEAVAGAAKPVVKKLEGGWTAETPLASFLGTPPQEFRVPAGATWVVEVVWESNPTTGELSFAVYDDAPIKFSGSSPLRKEFASDAPTGTLYLNSQGNVAVETWYTAYVSIFDGVPFDPEWSALP